MDMVDPYHGLGFLQAIAKLDRFAATRGVGHGFDGDPGVRPAGTEHQQQILRIDLARPKKIFVRWSF
jgi:hypothetical protein